MNLNKYDAQGWPYTSEEAAERAFALLDLVYLHRGYKRQTDRDATSPTFGQVIPEPQVKPYNAGRNAAKRLARKANGVRK